MTASEAPNAKAEAWDRLSFSPSEETNPAPTLVLDIWPPEWGGNTFQLF